MKLKLTLFERLLIMQLESVGGVNEQVKQLDFKDLVVVTQEYLDAINLEGKFNKDDKEFVKINMDNLFPLPKEFRWELSKDNEEFEIDNVEIIRDWIFLSCKKLPSPPSLLVQLYRRLR